MYICEVCGKDNFKKIRYGGYTLCSKHMHQLQKYGKFLDNIQRTNSDLNDYVVIGDIAKFNLYDRANKKVAEFIVDAEDVPIIKYCKWRLSYGRVVTGNNTNTHPTTYLSHKILGVKDTDYEHKIDHIDGNPLNNRKSNLRVCTQGQNTLNKVSVSNNTSGIIGVHPDKRAGRTKNWCAEIRINNKKFHIGAYKTLEEAAYARYVAECILFKEYRNNTSDTEKQKLFQTIPVVRREQIRKYVTNRIS